jgi:crotonobetainyl-CoA:carnitine CoA-transferase CaiB-like acyl-CoA transferase
MTTPLDGVRVLDLGGEMGAYGALMLGDLGADVVKAEPVGGDRQRLRPPFAPGASGPEASLVFAYYNANKRGVQVDLDAENAAEVLGDLASSADVILVAPSVQRPVPGWDPEMRTLSWAPSSAIVVVLSAYGIGGPYRQLRATHLVSFAQSGQMWALGPSEGPPRAIPGQPLYDELGAHAAFSAMVALRERPFVGGQVVDLSLHDMLAYRDNSALSLYGAVRNMRQTRQDTGSPPPSGAWDVADGQVELLTFQPGQWFGFVQMVGNPPEFQDPELGQRHIRAERADILGPRVAELFAGFTMDEAWDQAQENKVPLAPVNTPLQVTQNSQLVARGYWATHERPVTGTFRTPGFPFKSSTPLLSTRREAPLLDEHGDELLQGRWAAEPRGSLPRGQRIADLKVLSFGTAIAGNVTANTLAEFGADVVKIESPTRVDALRHGPVDPDLPRVYEPNGTETNIMYSSFSRSCRDISLNMKEPAEKELFLRLVAKADILIDNFATGTMESWGLTPQLLAEINPGLIMVSVSGYGRTGPRARTMAYASSINAFLGLTRTWSPHGSQFDYTAVANELVGLFGALAHRDRTGEGTVFDLAQVEAGGAMMAPLYLEPLATGEDVLPVPNHVPGSVLSGVYASAGDDCWFAVELENPDDWNVAAELLGASHLTVDGTWPSDSAVEQMTKALAAWAAERSNDEAGRAFQDVGLAAAPVRATPDEWVDAQLWARGRITRVMHPDIGPFDQVEPFQLLEHPVPRVKWAAARLGEHQEEVLRDWLGE